MSVILVVEDEVSLGKAIATTLSDAGHRAQWVPSGEEALAWVEKRPVDLAIVDVGLPGICGVTLLRKLHDTHPEIVVVMVTAHGDVPTAVAAMKNGAVDFLLKPIDLSIVTITAEKHLRDRQVKRSWNRDHEQRGRECGLDSLIGSCGEMKQVKAVVRRLAQVGKKTRALPNVLITGETGTGKDLLARTIHYEGVRRDGPFVQVNCGALPESLAESELFGHTKGAFTNASANKCGLFEVADGGTLFLDEIATLPIPVQAKLLSSIETSRIRPVGGVDDKEIDVALISAMNESPRQSVRRGTIRDDLLHRLRVLHIHLPPLRERAGDLDALTDSFLQRHCERFGVTGLELTSAARQMLRDYHWPGNIRELLHVLESAVLLSDDYIDVSSLSIVGSFQAANEQRGSLCSTFDFSNGPIPLERVERELIERALEASGHNITRAAALLDLSRDTLRYRLEKHGLQKKRMPA